MNLSIPRPSQLYLSELRNSHVPGSQILSGIANNRDEINNSVARSGEYQQVEWEYAQSPVRRPSRKYLWPVEETDSTENESFAFRKTGMFPDIDEIVHFLEHEKAVDIAPIDLTLHSRRDVGEWAIIGTMQSADHAKRVGNTIRKHVQGLKLENIVCFINAVPEQEWVVVRMGPVILHLMTKSDRALYALEDMYLQNFEDHPALASVLIEDQDCGIL